jgi:predicted DsbA family dithiol-disulfide isomerase
MPPIRQASCNEETPARPTTKFEKEQGDMEAPYNKLEEDYGLAVVYIHDKNDAITRMANQLTEVNQQIKDKAEVLRGMTDEVVEKNQNIKNTMRRA